LQRRGCGCGARGRPGRAVFSGTRWRRWRFEEGVKEEGVKEEGVKEEGIKEEGIKVEMVVKEERMSPQKGLMNGEGAVKVEEDHSPVRRVKEEVISGYQIEHFA